MDCLSRSTVWSWVSMTPQMGFGSRIGTDRLCLSVMVMLSDVGRQVGREGMREGGREGERE